jgi:hypothetical protein
VSKLFGRFVVSTVKTSVYIYIYICVCVCVCVCVCYKQVNEPLAIIRSGKFLNQVREYQLLIRAVFHGVRWDLRQVKQV